MSLISALYARSGRDPMDQEEIRSFAKAARIKRGEAMINLKRVQNEWERALVERLAIEQGR